MLFNLRWYCVRIHEVSRFLFGTSCKTAYQWECQIIPLQTIARHLNPCVWNTAQHKSLALKAIAVHEGTGVNRALYNNDRQIGKIELANTSGITGENSLFLRNQGNGDGFLNERELVQAQQDHLISIDEDGKIYWITKTEWKPLKKQICPKKIRLDRFCFLTINAFQRKT